MEYVNINREAVNKLVDKAKASHFKIIILLAGFLGEDSVWRNTNGTAMNIHDIAVVTEWSEKTVRECIKFALDNGIIAKTNNGYVVNPYMYNPQAGVLQSAVDTFKDNEKFSNFMTS